MTFCQCLLDILSIEKKWKTGVVKITTPYIYRGWKSTLNFGFALNIKSKGLDNEKELYSAAGRPCLRYMGVR